jgi:hypothetical protein
VGGIDEILHHKNLRVANRFPARASELFGAGVWELNKFKVFITAASSLEAAIHPLH